MAPGDNSGASIAAIPVIKEEYGFPTGCAIHNVVEKSKWLNGFQNARKTVDVSSNINIPLFGGDFAIFGPVENSNLVWIINPPNIDNITSFLFIKKIMNSKYKKI